MRGPRGLPVCPVLLLLHHQQANYQLHFWPPWPGHKQVLSMQLHLFAGSYDPKLIEGWKADPKSAFVGDGRFKASQEVSEGKCSATKPSVSGIRKTLTRVA